MNPLIGNTPQETIQYSAEALARAAFLVKHPEIDAWLAAPEVSNSSFLARMRELLESAGTLSPGQTDAVKRVLAEESAKRKTAAESKYLGAVGDVVEIEATTVWVIDVTSPRSLFAPRFIYILKTGDNQTIKYIGNAKAIPPAGETAHIQATIKALEEYQNTRQTIIERPRAIERVLA